MSKSPPKGMTFDELGALFLSEQVLGAIEMLNCITVWVIIDGAEAEDSYDSFDDDFAEECE